MISYGGGLPGGIFLPILTLGAILGLLYGKIMTGFNLFEPKYLAVLIIVGMAGYFGAIGKAPLTAIILVTEMVGDFSHLMPLAVTTVVAFVTADFLGGKPVYEMLLENLLSTKAQITTDVSGIKTLIVFPIEVGSAFDGRMVREFSWPEVALLTSLKRGEKEILTRGETVMHVGDQLQILTDKSHVKAVSEVVELMGAYGHSNKPVVDEKGE
jgi:hypothetical protein